MKLYEAQEKQKIVKVSCMLMNSYTTNKKNWSDFNRLSEHWCIWPKNKKEFFHIFNTMKSAGFKHSRIGQFSFETVDGTFAPLPLNCIAAIFIT